MSHVESLGKEEEDLVLTPEVNIGQRRRVRIYPTTVNHRSAPTPGQSYEEYLEADRHRCEREEAVRRVVWAARAKRMAVIHNATGGDKYFLDIYSRMNDGLNYIIGETCLLTSPKPWTASPTTLSYVHKLTTDQSGEHARPVKVCAHTAPTRKYWQSTITAQQWRRHRDPLPASEALL